MKKTEFAVAALTRALMTSPKASSRVSVLATRGGSLVARGAVAIVLGVLILVVPPTGLLTLMILWGSYAFADGIICAVVAIRARGDGTGGSLAFEGLVSVATGALTVLWRDPTVVVLLNLIVAWAALIGFSEVVGAIRLRRLMPAERVLAGMAIVAFAVGTVQLAVAGPRALALRPWLIDVYTLLFGALLIALGFGVHRWSRSEARSSS